MGQLFGPLFREKRRKAGLTQRQLAERAGLDYSYISKIENGRLPPPAADTIVVLCQVLGLTPDELLAITGKIPSGVQQMLSASPAAQAFLREAKKQGLSDEQWKRLTANISQLLEK